MSLHRTCCCPGEITDAQCADLIDCGLATSYNVSGSVNATLTEFGCTSTITWAFQNATATIGTNSCNCSGQTDTGTPVGTRIVKCRAWGIDEVTFTAAVASRSGAANCNAVTISQSGNGRLTRGLMPLGSACNLFCCNEVNLQTQWSAWYWRLAIGVESVATTDCPLIGTRPVWDAEFSAVTPMLSQCHPPPSTGWYEGERGGIFAPHFWHGAMGGKAEVREYDLNCNRNIVSVSFPHNPVSGTGTWTSSVTVT